MPDTIPPCTNDFCHTVQCIMLVCRHLSVTVCQFYEVIISVVFIADLCTIRIHDCLQIICVIINVADILFRTACYFGDSSKCIVFVAALTNKSLFLKQKKATSFFPLIAFHSFLFCWEHHCFQLTHLCIRKTIFS